MIDERDDGRISEESLRAWRHPSEGRLATLAVLGVLPVAILALALTVASLAVIPLVAVASLWLIGRITEAKLRGGAILVAEDNFADIARQISSIRRRLGYPKPVLAFIVQDDEVNALLWRVFGRKYLVLNTGLVASMTPAEREFVIARFVGALRARHLRFQEAASFIESLEKLSVLNLLVLPYLRATVHSGDRIGLMVCGDYATSRSALNKLMMGEKVGPKVSMRGLLEQGRQLRGSLFATLAILFSSHPHMTERHLQLLTFATEQGLVAGDGEGELVDLTEHAGGDGDRNSVDRIEPETIQG